MGKSVTGDTAVKLEVTALTTGFVQDRDILFKRLDDRMLLMRAK